MQRWKAKRWQEPFSRVVVREFWSYRNYDLFISVFVLGVSTLAHLLILEELTVGAKVS